MEGIDAAHAIRAADPDIGVVILSQYADESYAFELFKNGTAGLAYLLKDRVGDLQQLLAALREVTSGGSVIDPQVVDALVSRRARLRESPLARLTPRELDVLREMAQGRGNAGIAAELSLSESSVEKYVNAIFAKLDLASEQLVHRRVAAVLTFLRDAGLRSATSSVSRSGLDPRRQRTWGRGGEGREAIRTRRARQVFGDSARGGARPGSVSCRSPRRAYRWRGGIGR